MSNKFQQCEICKHLKFTSSEGIVCGLTSQKREPHGDCPDYETDAFLIAKKARRRTNFLFINPATEFLAPIVLKVVISVVTIVLTLLVIDELVPAHQAGSYVVYNTYSYQNRTYVALTEFSENSSSIRVIIREKNVEKFQEGYRYRLFITPLFREPKYLSRIDRLPERDIVYTALSPRTDPIVYTLIPLIFIFSFKAVDVYMFSRRSDISLSSLYLTDWYIRMIMLTLLGSGYAMYRFIKIITMALELYSK